MSNGLEFPCRSCGAKLGYKPGALALNCGYCGYTEAIPSSAEQVEEIAFADYKPDVRGYGVELLQYVCQQCAAQTQVEPHVTSFDCAFCASSQVLPQKETTALHKPESVLPFVVEQQEVLDKFRVWIKSLWFRPSELKKQARVDGMKGVYLPFWTYDALTFSFWLAESGHYYYEKDANGKRVRKTEWRTAAGSHDEFFDDVLIQGSPSVPSHLVRALEPFETKKLIPYKPEYLSGKAAEDYRRDMVACWPDARARIDGAIKAACKKKIPGDTHRNLKVRTSYNNRTYKLCLLPIWLASYRYMNKSYTYAVNGQTGRISGDAPFSWIKIAAFVLTLASLIGAFVYFQNA